jgi:DNA-binding transcriptional LysR family regulator
VLNLEQVTAYLTILQTGSFHESARRLGLSQASVSQQIRKLEQAVGAQLIVRDRAGCRVAPRTEDFTRYATAIMSLAERAVRAFTHPLVVVGAASNIGTYLLAPLHRRFIERYGDAAELRPVLDHNRAVADLLEFDAIDVALMEWWDHRPGFDAAVWHEEELVVIVGPNHPWRSRESVSVADLVEQPLLGGEPFSGTGTLLRARFEDADLQLPVAMNLGNTEAVKHAVRNGLGISLVLRGAVHDETESGSLRILRVAGPPLLKKLFVVHRSHLLPDAPVANFVNLVRSHGQRT